jgi:hypothetical protein
MTIQEQISAYINTQPEQKRAEMETLHTLILEALAGSKLWFEDGKDGDGKVVTNPTIGYGTYTIKYANGSTKEFFQIGMSANTTGTSIYIMGLKDKTYLAQTYGKDLGKASVTGYCIKFKSVKDINTAILLDAIQYGVGETN